MAGIKSLKIGNTGEPLEFIDQVSRTQIEETREQVESIDTSLDIKQDIATAVNYTNITNCITEIPRDIKFELSNGTLTLKAGSKVYVPNGFEEDGTTPKFDVIVTENDLSISSIGNNDYYVLYLYNENNEWSIKSTLFFNCLSGSDTEIHTNMLYYNESLNIIRKENSESSIGTYSLPLAICIGNASNKFSQIPSRNDLFDRGVCHFGNTIFVTPGIKGLIPNGRNEDGTLKNDILNIEKVLVKSSPSGYTKVKIFLSNDDIILAGATNHLYNVSHNLNMNTLFTNRTYQGVYIGDAVYEKYDDQYNLDYLYIKYPFTALEQNNVNGLSMPSEYFNYFSIGSSGTIYTANEDCWIYVSVNGSENKYIQLQTIGNELSGATNHYDTVISSEKKGEYRQSIFLPIKRGTKFTFNHNLDSSDVYGCHIIYATKIEFSS